MTNQQVRDAYAARAAEYTEKLGHMGAVAEPDRELVLSWAQKLTGPVADVGCGPGHWTSYLHDHGGAVFGIDPVPDFLALARNTYPRVVFLEGAADQIDVADETMGGIFAWYSLIHSTSEQVSTALGEFARALRPGGGLLLGFFEGPEFEPFAHAITTAYRWPISALGNLLQDAGFTITGTSTRTDPGVRPHGAITATRNAG